MTSDVPPRLLKGYFSNERGCERCLLITESPKTPSHYKYLMGPRLHPLYGIGSVQFCDFSCSCVYCDFEFLKFVFSTLQSRSCWQLTNFCLLRGFEGSLLWIDILCFCYRFGIFSKRFVGCLVHLMFSFAFLSLFCSC